MTAFFVDREYTRLGGEGMTVYLDGVMALNFLVDFLLLMGASRLCGQPPRWGRGALAAALGGIYGGTCLLPRFTFLGSTLWRVVCLALMGWIAYGFSRNAIRKCAVFLLLSMAMGGVAVGLEGGGFWSVAVGALGVFLICSVGFRNKIGAMSYLPVELIHGDCHLRLTALQDTGNTLKDPITGASVLVVDADVAQKLTGLTKQQLTKPAEAILRANLPGLRLIPYHTVGNPSGMLLGMRVQNVKIGNWQGSSVVAFAPQKLGNDGTYQALTGGAA